MDDELPPAEQARDRRRDRRISARERELMRTGSAKVFKQILDTQEKRARDGEGAEDDGPHEDPAGDPHAGERHRHGHGHGADRDR